MRRTSDNAEANVLFDPASNPRRVTLDSPVVITGGSSAATTLGELVAAVGFADVDSLGAPDSAALATGANQTGGTNATQATAGAQPLVVDAGVLVEGLRFAGGQFLRSVPSNLIVPPFTVAAWFRPSEVFGLAGDSYRIYSRIASSDASRGFISIEDSKICMNGSSGGSSDIVGGAVNVNTWYFVHGFYMPTSCQLFLDLVSQGSAAVTLSATDTTPIAIGSRGASDRFFKGDIPFVDIWPRALSAEEIATVRDLTDPR